MKQTNEGVNYRKARTTRKLFLLAALATFAGACVVNVEDEKELAPGDGERLVTLALAVPGLPPSRGTAEDAWENTVNTVDVLLFKGEDFYYRAVGSKPDNAATPYAIKNFTVRLPEGDHYKVVVLANASALLAAYPPATLVTSGTVTRAALLATLVQELGDPAHKWTEDFNYIPMWGYQDDFSIGETTGSPAATIDLTRAIARVNILVEDDPTLRGKFSLASVHLYNYSVAGSVAPAASGTGYDAAQWSGGKAILPNLPKAAQISAAQLKEEGPLDYIINAVPTTPVYACDQQIYTFEAFKGTAGTKTNTCLVIGGYYKAPSASAPVLTYYRVEFLKRTEGEPDDYLHLLRNHSYNVLITAVTGEGYPTVPGAYDNSPANITAEVLDWNDGAVGEIVFDGQNYLGVSPGELILYGDASANNRFAVTTDVSAGWSVIGTSGSSVPHEGFDAGWLSVTGPSSGPGDKTSVVFGVEKNISGLNRTAYIHVRAGRLNYAVKVTQGTEPNIGIWLEDAASGNEIQELVFSSSAGVQPAARSFNLRWAPADAVVVATKSTVYGNYAFEYAPGSHTPGEAPMTSIGNASGEMLITIQPPALTEEEIEMDPFIEKSSMVEFTLTSKGTTIKRAIYLRQANFYTVADVATNYLPDGSGYSFNIRSNTEWVVKPGTFSDPGGVLESTTMDAFLARSGGYDTDPGTTFSFQLANVTTASTGGMITFILADPTGRMPDVPVSISGYNCGFNGTAIPLRMGTRDYLTHVYNGKCWMVQNSKEGTYSFDHYSTYEDRCNGYYYNFDLNSATACKAPWRRPTNAEAEALVSYLNSYNLTSADARWWCGTEGINNNAFAGVTYLLAPSQVWQYWGELGVWWTANGSNIRSTVNYIDNQATGAIQRGYSVRCIRN